MKICNGYVLLFGTTSEYSEGHGATHHFTPCASIYFNASPPNHGIEWKLKTTSKSELFLKLTVQVVDGAWVIASMHSMNQGNGLTFLFHEIGVIFKQTSYSGEQHSDTPSLGHKDHYVLYNVKKRAQPGEKNRREVGCVVPMRTKSRMIVLYTLKFVEIV